MCGIVGIVSQRVEVSKTALVSMRDTMTHRGPDDAGVWISPDRRVALAQTRLAIVDLSSRGHQPMADSDGCCHIVFNGEIYNHRELRKQLQARGSQFTSTSDTEVILEAYRIWGTDCVQHLNGMFVFCLYDRREQRLFLARDRAGEKPLFYYHSDGFFAFGSELKSLMENPECPRELDFEATNFYLSYGYVPGSMCILKGFQKLAPAHAMTFDVRLGRKCIWRYWTLPEQAEQISPLSAEVLAEELEDLLLNSVRQQLQADVPVGILLSGGIDSSLVTALATRVAASPVKTFTVTFPAYPSYDEGPYARLVARHFGTEHTEVSAEPTSVELLPQLAAQFDEPVGDSSMVPTYLVSRAIRQHAKVALGGDGGDELFGGYPQHRALQRLARVARYVPNSLARHPIKYALRIIPVGTKGRNYFAALSYQPVWRVACVGRLFDLDARRALLQPLADSGGYPGSNPEEYRAAIAAVGRTTLQQTTIADFSTFLAEDILVKVDRASMLASLEVRAPWLDYRLIEFAFGRTPDQLRATTRETKILPRLLAQRLLPAELNLNRKHGFSLPLSSWFRGDWGRFLEEVLTDRDQIVFDKRTVRSHLKAQRRGFANTERLFSLAMFALWRRHYRISV
jgi:asparagine synthase (glutamine-hydrolysing)